MLNDLIPYSSESKLKLLFDLFELMRPLLIVLDNLDTHYDARYNTFRSFYEAARLQLILQVVEFGHHTANECLVTMQPIKIALGAGMSLLKLF